MARKVKIVSLLLVSIMLFFVGCKKNNHENETPNEPSNETMDEVIPDEIIQLLDNCPITNYQDISEFGFYDKSDNPLDKLFAAMCRKAMDLTGTTEYGEGEQKQKGLAYVSGYGTPKRKDKAYWIPRIGTNSVCPEPLYGIDCSGFIAHVMNAVGVGGINAEGRNELFEMQAWQQVNYFKKLTRLKTSQYTGLVKVEEFENVIKENIKNGDIIYRLDSIENGVVPGHIGIFFKRPDGELIMFQSSGKKSNTCPQNRHENGRGPIQRKINQPNLDLYFEANLGHARLLRIIADTNWVDLGLQSDILWANRNAGANSPEETGFYFAWGETQQKSNYVWETYKYWRNNSITKYNETDHLTTLQPNDDAATAHWSNLGNNCRMPTDNDWNELKTQCTQTFTTRNGVKGVLFTATNGNSLFLPAVGFRHEEGIFDGEHYEQYDGWGFYWSSSRSENNPNNASYVRFNSEGLFDLSEYLRLFGLSVRPVRSFP